MTRQDAMRLWRAHGGSQHGPRVETVTMPLDQFHDFVAAILKADRASAPDLLEALAYCRAELALVQDGSTGGVPNSVFARIPEAIEKADAAIAKAESGQ